MIATLFGDVHPQDAGKAAERPPPLAEIAGLVSINAPSSASRSLPTRISLLVTSVGERWNIGEVKRVRWFDGADIGRRHHASARQFSDF